MHRLHPLAAGSIALNRGLLVLSIPIVLGFVVEAVTDVDSLLVFALAPVGFVIGAAWGIAYYYRFEYGFTENTFDINSGVFARRSREIPYRRIQNVDIRQSVVFRLLSLAVVSIETAGGGSTEGSLNFVSESEAKRLQREIRRRTATVNGVSNDTTESEGEEPSPEPGIDRPVELFALRARELLLYSFTTFRPAAAAAVVFIAFLGFEFVLEGLVAMAEPVGGPADLETGTTTSYLILTAVSLVNAIVITYGISVAYTFATYYGFRLGRLGGDFVYERGLLQRYSGSIPAEKVQSVTVTDNPVQRAITYAGLWVETAGYGPDSGGGSQSAVPLAKTARVHRFTEQLTEVEPPTFRHPPTLARRRYLVRYSLVAGVIVVAALGLSTITPLERWYLAAVAFLGVPPAAHLRYVHLGYFLGEDNLVIRRGFWRRRTTVIPYYRIQTVTTRRSIFQRRLGLASLLVDTASSRTFAWGSPTIYDVELETARSSHESARERLEESLREYDEEDVGLSVDFT